MLSMFLSGVLVLVSGVNIFTKQNKNIIFKFLNVLILITNIILVLSGFPGMGDSIYDVILFITIVALMVSYSIE